jgi:hypothetical protein
MPEKIIERVKAIVTKFPNSPVVAEKSKKIKEGGLIF